MLRRSRHRLAVSVRRNRHVDKRTRTPAGCCGCRRRRGVSGRRLGVAVKRLWCPLKLTAAPPCSPLPLLIPLLLLLPRSGDIKEQCTTTANYRRHRRRCRGERGQAWVGRGRRRRWGDKQERHEAGAAEGGEGGSGEGARAGAAHAGGRDDGLAGAAAVASRGEQHRSVLAGETGGSRTRSRHQARGGCGGLDPVGDQSDGSDQRGSGTHRHIPDDQAHVEPDAYSDSDAGPDPNAPSPDTNAPPRHGCPPPTLGSGT
mmetsp:Transcript_4771/g.11897  ORF Transcript_4771/g.11897 Transcript_4771/m.11897 type:complete len:258 (+) Transcript_4771:582-1355(+)